MLNKFKQICISFKNIVSNNLYFFKNIYIFSKTYVIAQAALAIIEGLTPLIYIFMPKIIIDSILYESDFSKIIFYILVFAFIQLMVLLLRSFLNNRFINLNGHLYAMHFLFIINKKVATLDMKQLDFSETHQKIALAQDIIYKGIGTNLIQSFFKSISSIVILISTILVLLYADMALVFSVILFTIISVFLNIASENWVIKHRNENIYITRVLNYYISIMGDKANLKEMKILDFSQWLVSKYQKTLEKLKKKLKQIYSVNMRLNIIGGFVDWIKGNGIYLFLAWKTFLKQFTIGEFTQYFSATNQLSLSLLSFIDFIIQANVNSKYIESYRTFMEMKSNMYSLNHILKSSNKIKNIKNVISKNNFEIRLENVSFKYPNSDLFVLENINYKFTNGKTYIILGENGVGKSTLVNLISRLYEPVSGTIFLNEIPIDQIDYDQYRKLFSIVFQDFKHFSFTIQENVLLNKESQNEMQNRSKALKYLELAGLSKKISTLPNGINTQLDKVFTDDGIILSGGESQKLALARALAREAPIIILDEPSSALDPIAEDEILSHFSNISSGKLMIYISHRLTCVTSADEILFIKDKKIYEHGSHSTLIKFNGEYAKFYFAQSKHYLK